MPLQVILTQAAVVICVLQALPLLTQATIHLSLFKPARRHLKATGPNFDTMFGHSRSLARQYSGVLVTDNGNGLRIEKDGYLYERLAVGFKDTFDLTSQAVQINYRDPETYSLDIKLIQKSAGSTSKHLTGFTDATAFDVRVQLSQIANQVTISFTRFVGADLSQVIGFRIYGPVTVQLVTLIDDAYSKNGITGPRNDWVIDPCNEWVEPSLTHFSVLYNRVFYLEQESNCKSIHIGVGGSTWNMSGLALEIQYSATLGGKRQFKVQQESWSNNIMHSRFFVDFVDFPQGSEQVLIIPMRKYRHILTNFIPTNINAFIFCGPLQIDHVLVVKDEFFI